LRRGPSKWSPRELTKVGLLIAAMSTALFPVIGIGVLARFILDELSISRAELGLAITAASATSALGAIALGRLVDRLSGKRAMVIVFAVGGLAMAGIAVAPDLPMLLVAGGIAGLAMGIANPATNRLVVETIPRVHRGTVTGIKQAGEALTIVLCGLAFPAAALVIGWRPTFASVGIVAVIAIGLALLTLPDAAPVPPSRTRGTRPRLNRNIYWLTAYSLVVGLSAGSIATYLPLYAQEALGMGQGSAGLLMAGMGAVAVVGRVTWGHFATWSTDLRSRLRFIAFVGVAAVLLIWSASVIQRDLVWLGALAWGVSLLSVGALGHLAIMAYSDSETTGRASGVMLTGFGVGLMIGPPVFGWTIDTTHAYHVGFGLVTAELVALAAIATAWARRRQLSVETEAPPMGASQI